MQSDEIPDSVGGYRVGRRLGPARYLGHALAPGVVELVFLEQLSRDEQREAHGVAQDFASLSNGDRVAILQHTAAHVEMPRLTTPPALAESWRQMAAMATADPSPDSDEKPRGLGLVSRATRRLTKVRRGPLMLAACAGVALLVVVFAAIPSGSAPVPQTLAPETSTALNTENNGMREPAKSPTPLVTGDVVAEPLTSLGDMVLVRLPSSSSTNPDEIAVLERAGESWTVRNVYPDSPPKP